MRKLHIFALLGLAALIIGLAWADQMTLTTYYPAPYGVYRQFSTASKTCLATNPLGTDFGEDPEAMVGIGTTQPSELLEVSGCAKVDSLVLSPVSMTVGLSGQNGELICDGSIDDYPLKRWDPTAGTGGDWVPFGGVQGYDSKWFYVENKRIYEKNHNLGTKFPIVTVWFAPDASGSPDESKATVIDLDETYTRGTGVVAKTDTTFKVHTGTIDTVGWTLNLSGHRTFYNSGWIRIVAIAP